MNTPVSGAIAAPDPGWTRKARRDLAAVVIVSAAAAILCVKLNLSELLLSFTRPEERFQLDELPGILLVVALCLSWFSARRYGEGCPAHGVPSAETTRRTLAAALHGVVFPGLASLGVDAKRGHAWARANMAGALPASAAP